MRYKNKMMKSDIEDVDDFIATLRAIIGECQNTAVTTFPFKFVEADKDEPKETNETK